MATQLKRRSESNSFDPSNTSQNIQDHMSQLLLNSRKRRKMMTQYTNGDTDNDEQDEEVNGNAIREDSEDSSNSEDEQDEEEDEDEEEDYGDDDLPAQAGVIEKLSLKNFMCHDSFELKLGPQINFIIGRNGSGKSAILTGISVGLGAKANDTNRGSSIKDLIKDGKQTSRISIIFKNEGTEAYKPNEYGKKIIIERKLQRVGGNSYAIKNEKGKTISTKKAILDEILYKFNITIDNPLAFLSQDKAREFLTSATDKTKYGFFMDGAYITEILKNFQVSSASINELRDKVLQAQNMLLYVKEIIKEIAKVYNAHKINDHLRTQLQIVNGKIYWFNAKMIRSKLEEFEGLKAQYISDLDKIKETVSESNEAVNNLKPEKEKINNEIREANDIHKQKYDFYEQINSQRQELKSKIEMDQNEFKKNENEIQSLENDIKKLKIKIEEEQTKLDAQKGGSKEALEKKFKDLEIEIDQLENEISDKKALYNEIDKNNNPDFRKIKDQIVESNDRLEQLNREKFNLLKEEDGKYAPWGSQMLALIRQIDSRYDWTSKPIGPIGSFIQVKSEYNEWKVLLNTILSKVLDSFIVTNEKDRYKLDQLLRRNKIRSNIIVRKTERLQYESGKPSSDLTTVLDMLEFQEEFVLYTLIDTAFIEKTIIANDLNEARNNCKKPNVFNALMQFRPDSGKRISYQNNTMRLDPIYYNHGNLKFGATKKADVINDINRALSVEQRNKNDLERSARAIAMKIDNERDNLQVEINKLQRELQLKKNEKRRIQDKLDEEIDDANIRNFKINLKNIQEQIERLNGINQSVQEELTSRIEQIKGFKDKREEAKHAVKKQQLIINGITDKLVELEEKIQSHDGILKNLAYEEVELQRKLDKIIHKIQDAIPKLEDMIEEGNKYCKEEEASLTENDTQESIAQEFQDINAQLQEAENALGSSLEEVIEQLKAADKIQETAKKTLEDLSNTQNQLQDDLNARLQFLHTTIKVSVEDASRTFERAMRVRGFKGSLLFNFADKTLKLIVQTKKDDEKRTVESLSGGEKSFSQIALLLSIWKIMNSRIRGLDEFDVYMDQINRNISVKLLLNELKQYPKSQNIFITPQDIKDMVDLNDKSVRIHQMSNPRDD